MRPVTGNVALQRNADLLRRLFHKLEEYGWLRPCAAVTGVNGRVPAKVWEIVRP